LRQLLTGQPHPPCGSGSKCHNTSALSPGAPSLAVRSTCWSPSSAIRILFVRPLDRPACVHHQHLNRSAGGYNPLLSWRSMRTRCSRTRECRPREKHGKAAQLSTLANRPIYRRNTGLIQRQSSPPGPQRRTHLSRPTMLRHQKPNTGVSHSHHTADALPNAFTSPPPRDIARPQASGRCSPRPIPRCPQNPQRPPKARGPVQVMPSSCSVGAPG
jgi:hypothetical protein